MPKSTGSPRGGGRGQGTSGKQAEPSGSATSGGKQGYPGPGSDAGKGRVVRTGNIRTEGGKSR